MKLHTILDRTDLTYAARQAGVRFHRLEQSGSRTHTRKFDLILTSPNGGRGSFGGDYQAATWDEWGIFLNVIFEMDPDARAAGYYEAREHFRWATGHRFDTLTPDQQHLRHRWNDGSTHSQSCACGAIRRWDPPTVRATRPIPPVRGLSGPARPVLALAEVFPPGVGSRYESDGRYARELAADGIVQKIDEVLADD